METENSYIEYFKVHGMWNRIDLEWNDIRNDVNILVGINGGGKTTLMNLIADYYVGKKPKKVAGLTMEGNPVGSPVTYLRSFDIPANSRKKTESLLLQDLKFVINQNGEGSSFFDYRMRMLNYPEEALQIQERISKFFRIVDSLFAETNKSVAIDPQTNTLVFHFRKTIKGSSVDHSIEEQIRLDQLSSGEKQILLILTTVFLQNEQPCVLLMDEPEISLHISWQDRLISMIRELNPNCQLILTTHSPNIFADGWEDKIVFIEDLIR